MAIFKFQTISCPASEGTLGDDGSRVVIVVRILVLLWQARLPLLLDMNRPDWSS